MSSMINAAASSSTSTLTVAVSSARCGASAEERLLALIVHTQTSQLNAAETSVTLSFEQIEQLRDEVKRALEQAKEAKKDAGFWADIADLLGSDLATLATAVAAIAAVVASGGAATAILAVIAASASLAADHAEELGIPPEVAAAVAVAAGVASFMCGDTRGLFKVTDAVRDVAKGVQLYAGVTAGVSTASGGGASMVEAKYELEASYAYADARHASGRQGVVSSDMADAFDRLSAALDKQDAAIRVTSDIRQQSAASSDFVLSNFGGVA